MFKHNKLLIFTVVLTVMLLGLSMISASDDADIISDNVVSQSDNLDTSVEIDENIEKTADTAVQNDVENKDLKSSDKNIKTDPITISKSNYADIFEVEDDLDGEGSYLSYGEENAVLTFSEDLPETVTGFVLYGNNITLTATEGTVFKNKFFEITGSHNTIKGLTLTYDADYMGSFERRDSPIFVGDGAEYATVDDVTLTCDVDDFIEVIDDVPFYVLDFDGNNTVVKNSRFYINTTTYTVDWDQTSPRYGHNRVMPIMFESSIETYSADNDDDHIQKYTTQNFTDNTVEINAYEADGGFPTMYAITIKASYTIMENNNIKEIGGSGWLYALQARSSNNTLDGNIIDVSGVNYTAGITIEDGSYNLVSNNIIFVNSSMEESAYDPEAQTNEYVAYGIVITDYAYKGANIVPGIANAVNNSIINNTINGLGYNIYGIEEFGGENTTFSGNVINVKGNTALALGAYTVNVIIENNTLQVDGDNVGGTTVDYLGARTTGVLLGHSVKSNATVVNNTIISTKPGIILDIFDNATIQNNSIITDYETSIILTNSSNNVIQDNYLKANNVVGSTTIEEYSIEETRGINTIGDNGLSPTELTVDCEEEVIDFDHDAVIYIELTSDDVGIPITQIKLYDNGELLEVISPLGDTPTSSMFYNYVAIDEGLHELLFKFERNLTHNESQATLNITVVDQIEPETIDTSIELDGGEEISFGDDSVISGVFSADGTGTSAVLTVYDNEVEIDTVEVDDEGLFMYSYESTSVGEHIIRFVFAGNDTHVQSEASVTITVEKAGSSLDLTYNGEDITVGESATITVEFYAGDYFTGFDSITVYDNDEQIAVISSDNGEYDYEYISTTVGEHVLKFVFAGNESYTQSSETVTINVKAQPIETQISLTGDDEAFVGEDIIIFGTFTAAGEEAVADIITVYENDEQIATITDIDDDGSFIYNYESTSVGEHTLTFKFAGNETHLTSSQDITFTINSLETGIELTYGDGDITLNDEAIILGEFTANGEGTTTDSILVYDNNEQIDEITDIDEDGLFSYIYTPTTVGEHELIFKYIGNNIYTESSESITITVKPLETSIDVTYDGDDIVYGDIATVNGVFMVDGVASSVDAIVVYDNGVQIGEISSDGGVFGFDYMGEALGDHVLTFAFAGNDTHLASNATVSITVNEPILISTIVFEPVTGTVNTPATLTTKITDEEGNPVTAGYVIFKDEEGNVIGKTNVEDGTASINVLFKKEVTKEITATYVNPSSFVNNIQNTTTLTIQKPGMSLTFDDINAKAGITTFTAKVSDGTEKLVNGGKVVFKINGQTLKDENGKVIYATVKDGIASINYTIPSNWVGKTYNITAVYSGSSIYESVRNDTTFTVAKSQATVTITPIDAPVKVDSVLSIKVKVTDNDVAVTNGKVVLKLNGKTLKDDNGKVLYLEVDENGEVSLDYTLTNIKARTYPLTAVFTSNLYEKSEASVDVEVIK